MDTWGRGWRYESRGPRARQSWSQGPVDAHRPAQQQSLAPRRWRKDSCGDKRRPGPGHRICFPVGDVDRLP